MKRVVALIAVGFALAASAIPVQAAPIIFTPPGTSFTANNVGQARSVIFDVTSPTSVTSFGIQMDPLIAAFSLRADLYTVNPTTFARNPLVASSTVQAFTDTGLAFYDVSFAQSFVPGVTYELELQPPASGGFGFGQFNMTFFNFNGFPPGSPPNAPFLAGPFRILDRI